MLFNSNYGGRTIGLKVVQTNGNFTVSEVWKPKAQDHMTTSVVIRGVAYSHLKSQRIMAIEIDRKRELNTLTGFRWSREEASSATHTRP